MPRYALGVEYDGTDYYGWQTQHQQPTLQSTLEAALARVANERVTVTASGRTDTGVHASGQVVHFDTNAIRTERAWVLGTNCHLPPTMALRWARRVEPDFHARFSAQRRRYRYHLLRRATRPALAARLATWIREPIDVDAMRRAAAALIGEHDYTSFRTVACQSRTPIRRMYSVVFEEFGEGLDIVFEANAFLHHMVRNLVGSLLVVGRGERPPEWIAEVLAARDRCLAGPTAPPTGLVYEGPLYPASWGLPREHCL